MNLPGVHRESLDVDVLIVGAGPAGLAAALHLAKLAKQASTELAIAVIDKAREPGAHMLSGAVLDPVSLRELVPDCGAQGAPLEAPVHEDHVFYLTRTGKLSAPIIPPPLRNHGNYVISLNRLVKWLSGLVEAAGVDLFAGFAGSEVLYDGDRVIGVRTGDKGVDKHGTARPTYEPGVDIRARVTIFAEGVRGSLTKTLVGRLRLDEGRQPQVYSIGVKELWEVPRDRLVPGTVIHTLGFPLDWDTFGGGFIYAMPEGRISIGLVIGLDYRDPLFDPHLEFQRYKTHPFVSSLLAGGEMVRYGAKALPEGGWHAIPRCYASGALIVGDAGGFLNSLRLKGIHLAIKTGMLAAEATLAAIKAGDVSERSLARYEGLINHSLVREELHPVRNVHQSFAHGLLSGVAYSGLALLTGGWWVHEPMTSGAGHTRMRTLAQYHGDGRGRTPELRVDRTLTFDKLTDVHLSGTRHEEDQPVHLLVADTDICRTRCLQEFGNPCQWFCPASVYEMVDAPDGSGKRLQINASNCVHCKTCDIMDPYQIITWVPPEGGGGPVYEGM